jgi:branched-chain amino acid transport system permease protein
MIFLIGLLTFTGLALGSPAMADDHEFSNFVAGNVKNEGEPIEGVRIVVSGQGFTTEALTDAEGKFRLGVPAEGAYEVTLDESTLPEGVSVTDGASQTVEIGQSGRVTKNFFIGETVRDTIGLGDQIVSRIINGLNFGLMLALASVGLSLVFGTTGLSNFSHAEMVTFGAAMALLFGSVFQFPLWAAIIAAVILSGALGWALDAGLWKPLRGRGLGLVQLMIVSIGLSLTARYIFQFFMGGGTKQLPGFDSPKQNLFGAVALSNVDIASMIISLVVIIAFAIWLTKSKTGKATRAISDNASLAAASGIDVDKVVRIVWVLAAALAGLSGVLWAYFRPGVKWDMGAQILLLIFAAVTLGGLGTAYGALIGSIIVGVLIETSALVIPADLKYVGALVVLIVILLFRPQGILGRRERIG